MIALAILGYGIAAQVFVWDLPKGFPTPHVPADNPMTPGKVELGRYLFYDTQLSFNGKQACATCHKQELAFTDGRAVGIGTTGEKHARGPMSLVNVAYSPVLTWNNPNMKSLEEQALVPLFGEHPIELGLQRGGAFLSALQSDVKYQTLFAQAFPHQSDRFTVDNITKAIACFERSIISARSPYDRYHYGGDDDAVSASAKRGEILYFSQPLTCFRCHGGFTFSGGDEFHAVGQSQFKSPTLRNIMLTAPYMHDGSMATLDEVLNGHADAPQGRLSAEDRQDLIEFLKTLTDEAVLRDKRFANPW